MEDQPITGIKNITGSVYHLPAADLDVSRLSKCGISIDGRFLAIRFEGLNDVNICKHCAMKAIREGA